MASERCSSETSATTTTTTAAAAAAAAAAGVYLADLMFEVFLAFIRSSRVPTGQGKLKKVREFESSGKVREKSVENIFWKSQGKAKGEYQTL